MAARGHPTLKGSKAGTEVAQGKPLGRATTGLKTWADARAEGRADFKRPEGKRGNCKMDHEWVTREQAAGRLKVIEDDTDIPFGVRLKWDGKAETWGSELQLPPEEHRCTGRSYVRDDEGGKIIDADGRILTRPCAKWRMRGLHVCGLHGGMTDGGKAAAKRRLIEASDMAAGWLLRIIEDADTETSDRLKAIFGLMDRAGIKGGEDVTIEVPAWQQMLKEMWEAPEGSPEAQERQELVDRGAAVMESMVTPPKTKARKAAPPTNKPAKATKATKATPTRKVLG